jgi:hypothetical protein
MRRSAAARFAVDVILGTISTALAFAVREPAFPNALQAGRKGGLDCVSCNIRLAHDGFDPLKCWRKSAADLAYQAVLPVLARPRSSLKSGPGSCGARRKTACPSQA